MKTSQEWVDKEDTQIKRKGRLGGKVYTENVSLYSLTISYESDHTEEELQQFVKEIQRDAVWHCLQAVANSDSYDDAMARMANIHSRLMAEI